MESRNAELFQTQLEKRRARAWKTSFDSFCLWDGHTIKNVTITGVDDSGVAIRHEHGAARLRYAELSDDQRLFFGLEEATTHAAEDRERLEALAYELSIDREIEAMRGREVDERADSIAQRNKDLQFSRSLMAGSGYQHELRPIAQPAISSEAAHPIEDGTGIRDPDNIGPLTATFIVIPPHRIRFASPRSPKAG